MTRRLCSCGIPGCPYLTEWPEPDPSWTEWYERALRLFEGESRFGASNPEGESPLDMFRRTPKTTTNGWGADFVITDDDVWGPARPGLGALPIITSDETEGHYGTSGDLDPRGYWMPIDGEASR